MTSKSPPNGPIRPEFSLKYIKINVFHLKCNSSHPTRKISYPTESQCNHFFILVLQARRNMPENPWSADLDPEGVTTSRHRFSYHQEIKTQIKTKTSTNVILCPQIMEAKWEGFNSSFVSLSSQTKSKVLDQSDWWKKWTKTAMK